MATVYFTTNADSGSGSLRAAISSAEAGDVIMPDPNVFTSGPITIALSSVLINTTGITIDGGELGIVLDGQNSNISAVSLSVAGATTLINCTIKRFKRTTAAPVYLNHASAVLNLRRCIIADNSNRYYGAVYVIRGDLNLFDSLIVGNDLTTNNSSYAAIYIASGGSVTATRTTVSGNVNANISGTSRFTNVNTFVGLTPPTIDGTTPEEIGFVTPPPSATIPYGEHTEGDWQSWDFRLKPTSPYLTGASYQAGDKDLLGHDRTGSWGCYDGSWLVVGASGAETVASDAAVDWLEIASTGVLTLSGADRILTVSRGVFVESGAAITSASRGYVVAPSASDCSSATLTNVVCCISGAGASNLSASTTGFSWSATDSTKTVVLEKQVSGAWTTVAQTSGTSYSETLSAGDSVRLFDGVNFLTATVVAPVSVFSQQYQAVVGTVPLNGDQEEWTAVTGSVTPWKYVAGTVALNDDWREWQAIILVISVDDMDENIKPGQAISVLARIYDAFDNKSPLLNDGSNIASVYYTCEKKTKGLYDTEYTPIAGHTNVSAGTDCVLAQLANDDAWDKDETGYNFLLTPDIRTNQLFTSPGTYRIVATINLTSGNPITLYKEINVVN